MGSRASPTPPWPSISAWVGAAGSAVVALAVAVGLTAAWACVNLLLTVTQALGCSCLAALVDVLRIGAWYAFLLLLNESPRDRSATAATPRTTWLVPVAAALVLLGLFAQVSVALRLTPFGDPGRFVLFQGIALSVFGLVLLEQLFRSLPEDARWNIKPLCLGLAGAFIFDLYLFADALLFNRVDADAWSVRGFIYALVFPLLVMSTMRTRNWTLRIALSRRVVFHSTALMATGAYLLFMAAAGYYVRYFGGNWGGALQVALVFHRVAGAWRDGVFGVDSREVARDRQQALLQLPLRLSRRVAAFHPCTIGAGRAERAGAGRNQGARRHAGKPGRKPLAAAMRRAAISCRPHVGTCPPMPRRSPPTAGSRGF